MATPLGNLGDASPRAREILERADLILAEDTRRTGLLLKSLGVGKKHFLSLHEHNESGRTREVLSLLGQGLQAALVSDAGTPLISDPGYLLVRAVHQAGFKVSPVPGPSAAAAALSVSGLPPIPFTFLGFLPRKPGEQRKTLHPFAELKTTLILFERKNRLAQTLATAFDVLGEREICIARELTKAHEQVMTCRLSEAPELASDLLGEITVVIGPPREKPANSLEDIESMLGQEMRRGGKPGEIVSRVAGASRDWTRKQVYEVYRRLKSHADNA